MTGMKSGAAAYARVGVESQAMTASPLQLTCMLYEGAIKAIRKAKAFMAEMGEPNAKLDEVVAQKGAAISKAIDIIGGLDSSLDKEIGGEMAQNLSSLYDYMSQTLTKANIHNDLGALDHVIVLLEDFLESWRKAGEQVGAQ
ncbi:flagellar export chaperone FliS [Pseudomonas aeruginosa]